MHVSILVLGVGFKKKKKKKVVFNGKEYNIILNSHQ